MPWKWRFPKGSVMIGVNRDRKHNRWIDEVAEMIDLKTLETAQVRRL